MSNRITQLCRPVSVTAAQKAVLMCLADRSDDEGAAWPSIPGICEWTCLKRTAVIGALKAIGVLGLVSVVKESGKNNRFQLNLSAIAARSSLGSDRSAKRTGAGNGLVRETDPTRTPNEPPPVREANHTRPPDEPEASISIIQASESTNGAPAQVELESMSGSGEPPAKSKKRRKVAVESIDGIQVPEWMPLESWQAFVKMRQKIGKPLTQEAVAASVKKLARFREDGFDPSEILEDSVVGSWQGLFAPKQRGRNPSAVQPGVRPSLLNADEPFTGAKA